MNTSKQLSAKASLLCAVASGLVWVNPTATAQIFTTLKSFGILANVTGFNPSSQLVQGPEGTLYGTTYAGEGNVRGTVFKVHPNGSGFTVLKWFTNSVEGAWPFAGLALSGSVLYGTTVGGGSSSRGTVFKMNTDGTGYTVLKHFTGSDGAYPDAALTSSGSVLYGTTLQGGSSDFGTVFKMNTDGSGFTVLKNLVHSDGAYPDAALTLSGSVLYGTTSWGGSSDNGTVFQVNTDGTGFSVLKHFSGNDGQDPSGGLTLTGGALYGTMGQGGSLGLGAVFRFELFAPISLTVQALGDAIILGWSNPDFALQAAAEVTGTYTNITGATSPYTNAISGPQGFFRLVGN